MEVSEDTIFNSEVESTTASLGASTKTNDDVFSNVLQAAIQSSQIPTTSTAMMGRTSHMMGRASLINMNEQTDDVEIYLGLYEQSGQIINGKTIESDEAMIFHGIKEKIGTRVARPYPLLRPGLYKRSLKQSLRLVGETRWREFKITMSRRTLM